MNCLKRSLFLLAISFVLVGGCNTSGGGGRSVSVSPNVPSDIPGGAPNADLQEAAVFAWQEFIALNWPAESGTRDTPDTTKLFGNSSFDEPLVWQTYRHKVEIYPGMGNPPGFDANSPDFGYDTVPPQYIYSEGEIDPCEGQTPVETPAWINLDEISQIGLDSMFAGTAPGEVNTNPQLFRFLAKGNKEQYVYVVDPILSLWDHTPALILFIIPYSGCIPSSTVSLLFRKLTKRSLYLDHTIRKGNNRSWKLRRITVTLGNGCEVVHHIPVRLVRLGRCVIPE